MTAQRLDTSDEQLTLPRLALLAPRLKVE